jgi:ABC-type phosphate/phosphonate transport system ATPase subunit
MAEIKEPSIKVRDLSYKFPDGSSGLQHLDLDLPSGSRTLLIGGKSSHLMCQRTTPAKSSERMVLAKQRCCGCSPASACRPPAA